MPRISFSFRIYEFLVQLLNIKEQTLYLNWLRDALCLGEKYPKIADLRKFVLEPSVRDINNLSNLQVSIEPIKVKREIVAYKFIYSLKEPAKKQPHKKNKWSN